MSRWDPRRDGKRAGEGRLVISVVPDGGGGERADGDFITANCDAV